MKDRSDDPSHNERTLLPWSYKNWFLYIEYNNKEGRKEMFF